ncbi:blast:Chromodomain-helicase-DNA-binding protein Mi-2 homolog, partial [Drosophila guanche]
VSDENSAGAAQLIDQTMNIRQQIAAPARKHHHIRSCELLSRVRSIGIVDGSAEQQVQDSPIDAAQASGSDPPSRATRERPQSEWSCRGPSHRLEWCRLPVEALQ